ncbi:MAG: hypothetical protein J0J04_08195 [Microbacterium sp.]|uniref:hypothetical protein n=1 Tax=Microbacterium sp. TaxID=51671 RepID=UPI001AC92326|nr:hypothetical protein [Microbacterium sp.]MBN9214781.1 hypothetical protein [Microbacterium sp.]
MTLTVHEFHATSEAHVLGLTAGAQLDAVQWDGTAGAADEIIDWVEAAGGIASRIDGAILVADAGDVQFASPGSWVAATSAGHLVLGAAAIGRICAPERPADELVIADSADGRPVALRDARNDPVHREGHL